MYFSPNKNENDDNYFVQRNADVINGKASNSSAHEQSMVSIHKRCMCSNCSIPDWKFTKCMQKLGRGRGRKLVHQSTATALHQALNGSTCTSLLKNFYLKSIMHFKYMYFCKVPCVGFAMPCNFHCAASLLDIYNSQVTTEQAISVHWEILAAMTV